MKKIIITENQLKRVLLKEDIVSKVVQDNRLVMILKKIEEDTGMRFTQLHFNNEMKISGGIKQENGSLDESALAAFENLKKDCPGLTYDEDSYRTYERQAELFTEYVKQYGSIEGAMRLRAIPGFSQHHTGKAFDVKPREIRDCVGINAKKHGFEFPYRETNIRVAEPWHIYFNK